MSDLKHKSDDELVQIIQSGYKFRARLTVELAALEEAAARLRGKINNSAQRCDWATRYLEGSA